MIPVVDVVAGSQPYVIMTGDECEGTFQVLELVGLTRMEGVQAHDPPHPNLVHEFHFDLHRMT